MTASIFRLAIASCLVFSACTGSSSAGGVPRYAPKPGQVLTYEENQIFKSGGESSAYRTTWRIWVVGRNDDGSWRMVVRESMKTLGEAGSGRARTRSQPWPESISIPTATSPARHCLARGSTPRTFFPACPQTRRKPRPAGKPAMTATTRRSDTSRSLARALTTA